MRKTIDIHAVINGIIKEQEATKGIVDKDQ